MMHRRDYKVDMAAYLADRLLPDQARAFEDAVRDDPQLAREVDALREVEARLSQLISETPAPDYRLSPERRARVLAEAHRDIVRFPNLDSAPARPRARLRERISLQQAASGLAAAAALVVGAIVGLETGRLQFDETGGTLRASLEAGSTDSAVDYPNSIHYYPPAYGLDHADALRFAGRAATADYGVVNDYDLPSVVYTADAPPYLGLAGPRPAYLSGRTIDRQP